MAGWGHRCGQREAAGACRAGRSRPILSRYDAVCRRPLGLSAVQEFVAAESSAQRATVEHLSALGSQVAGYPGSDRAADYVEGRFRALGLEIHWDTFSVVVPLDRGGRLAWDGESVALYALWPNAARTVTLPPEGLRGPAIWAEDGDWEDFNGRADRRGRSRGRRRRHRRSRRSGIRRRRHCSR